MELQFQLLLTLPAERALAAAAAMLLHLGYAPCNAAPPRFRRGQLLLTPFRFSPRDWHVEVTTLAQPVPGGVHLTLHYAISTFGQWVTEREREFFRAEARELLEAVAAGQTTLLSPRTAELARRENVGLVFGGAAGTAAFTILLGALFGMCRSF